MSNQYASLQNNLTFQVEPEERRELSVNHSIVTSVYSHKNSYEELLQFFKSYVPMRIDLQNLHKSSKLKLKKYKQAVYYGEFVNGMRQGLGLMVYNNGQIFQGPWKSDMREGYGYQKFANGGVYEGNYQKGKMNGQGKYTWANGQVYQGQWVNNLKHGSGMWKNEKGDTYIGEWAQGQANGLGVFIETTGSRFQGNFINFVKSGNGTELFQSGDLYKGSYQEGKFHGFGQYYWKDGSYYKGQFEKGVRSGYGVWKKNTGKSDKYEGQFHNNKKQGYGIYTWACGHIYKGNYKNNLRQGYGQMFWENGSFYRGSWQRDMQNGEGELFDGNSEHLRGTFVQGQFIDNKSQQINQNQQGEFQALTIPKTGRKQLTSISRGFQSGLNSRQPPSEEQSQYNRTTITDFYKKQIARVIKFKEKPRNNSPLIQESFLKKKLLKTLQLRPAIPAYSIDYQKLSKKGEKRYPSREAVPHSAFQIHRIHRNMQIKNGRPVDTSMNVTLDSRNQFAFKRRQIKERSRNYSRLT